MPDSLVDALAQTSFVVMGALTRIAAQHDLSLTQLRVLGILRDREPRMAELADFLGLERSTLSGLVARAEQRGLVERRRRPEDRRVTEVAMTPAARQLAEQVYAEVDRALAPLTDRLPRADHPSLLALLSQLLPAPPDARPAR